MRRFRWLNKLYAHLFGYFWLPCPICRQMFGGHETAGVGLRGPYRRVTFTVTVGGVGHNADGFISRGRCVCWRCGECAKDINMQHESIIV